MRATSVALHGGQVHMCDVDGHEVGFHRLPIVVVTLQVKFHLIKTLKKSRAQEW